MPLLDNNPIFVLALGNDGQITISQLSDGDLSSASLSQLYTSQRDIAGATKLIEAEIIKNLS